jgi:hypothetical protein
MKEDGVDFNAGDLHRLGYIAASTALEILKKLNTVIFSEMEAESNAIDVYSGQFAPIVCKRSLETPANEHPTTEQDELEKRLLSKDQGAFAPGSSQSSGGTHSRRAAVNALSGPQLAVYELLSTDPIDFETLREKTNMPIGPLSATLSLLELEELVERLTGDKYVCSTGGAAASRKAWAMQSSNGEDAAIYGTEMISSSINFVRSGFHGVSRKYLQLYLAAHWCHVDRARWSSNKLLKACRRFREVKPAEIRAFVSPLFMKVMPCASLT